MNSKILKLAKMILAFASLNTDNGTLSYTGELVEGVEVFIEKDGEFIPAEDGEYVTDDSTITVKDGKVEKIEPIEAPEEDPKPEEDVKPEELEDEPNAEIEELNKKIEELNQVIADKDEYISELEAKVKELEDKLNESAGKKAEEEFKNQEKKLKENKALKYFSK